MVAASATDPEGLSRLRAAHKGLPHALLPVEVYHWTLAAIKASATAGSAHASRPIRPGALSRRWRRREARPVQAAPRPAGGDHPLVAAMPSCLDREPWQGLKPLSSRANRRTPSRLTSSRQALCAPPRGWTRERNLALQRARSLLGRLRGVPRPRERFNGDRVVVELLAEGAEPQRAHAGNGQSPDHSGERSIESPTGLNRSHLPWCTQEPEATAGATGIDQDRGRGS